MDSETQGRVSPEMVALVQSMIADAARETLEAARQTEDGIHVAMLPLPDMVSMGIVLGMCVALADPAWAERVLDDNTNRSLNNGTTPREYGASAIEEAGKTASDIARQRQAKNN